MISANRSKAIQEDIGPAIQSSIRELESLNKQSPALKKQLLIFSGQSKKNIDTVEDLHSTKKVRTSKKASDLRSHFQNVIPSGNTI